jgi:hypothetical protein
MDKKAIVCLYGVIPRSIKYTIKTMKENIINTLKEHFSVDIYVFNMNVENELVDDTLVNQNDINLIPYTFFEEKYQKDFDLELNELQLKYNLKFRDNYTNENTQNALRQMYSEYRVGLFLENNPNYDLAVSFSSDMYFANKINIHHCLDSCNNNKLYGCKINEGQGYSNGFFFGNVKSMIKIYKRFEQIETYLPVNADYEYVLKMSFDRNNIERIITDIIVFKIRANRKIFGWPNVNYNEFCDYNKINYIVNNIFNNYAL